MGHWIDGRVICDTTHEEGARDILNRIAIALKLDVETTVCEIFGENPQFYDVVFRAPVPAAAPDDLIAYFEGLLERIDGNWIDRQLAQYGGERFQCFAVIDNYVSPQGGIAWMSLSLNPRG